MPTLDDPLIADYLEQLRRELQASPDKEQEILREVRAHLLFAARDVQECGGEASSVVLERFGSASQIGQELRQVHGRAGWKEAVLAGLPLLLLGIAAAVPGVPVWVEPVAIGLPVACTAAWVISHQTRWPLWGWAWLGCLPLVIPNIPPNPLWGALAYLAMLLLVRNRNWLEATLALYPLPTAWAFSYAVLNAREVQMVGWSPMTTGLLGVTMAAIWMALLVGMLRTPSGRERVTRALESQGIVFLANTLVIVTARLWPTYPFPYPYTVQYFVLYTMPYALFNGLSYLLFALLTSLPAILALVKARARHQGPSRPVWSG